jgi:cytoskeletal protein RodZ
MTADTKSWFAKVRGYRQTDFSTQAAVLLPVVTIAGLTAWMVLSSASSAKSQSVAGPPPAISAPEKTSLADPVPAPTRDPATPAQATPPTDQATSPAESPPPEASPLDGLKIASQSWRRGGLGSNAFVTFTLRNNNDYAVKDIEIACAFNRRDGSHLTDRTRVIRDTINMKSRKTFARMHVGFVNINASRAKCSLVAASRL